ncbi:hypothetical protein [Ferruginibacter sp. HRS2-29]|uniref:hypothetical protein n=1 Tax=Ferruginibacter sp. HRS2-29 TaxID=2487334 RepID=UPI0020CFDA40|nr:hypothetical protein [Ferruginibacter sp. HRS2-29]MCP9750623.1 hypothetical protein [Ferruginibacter sp. HRS2-29]
MIKLLARCAIAAPFLFLFLISCKSGNSNAPGSRVATNTVNAVTAGDLDYSSFLKRVKEKNRSAANKQVSILKANFCKIISDSIPAYWTGTPWDFNGTTRLPQRGAIACGYFITNTLDDIGIPLNRTRLAQEPSSVLIKALCVNITRVGSLKKLQQYVSAFPADAVFIIGLDFHTGYLLKENGMLYFLHSNYMGKKGVMKEPIGSSLALKNSRSWMIGCISENELLLRRSKFF